MAPVPEAPTPIEPWPDDDAQLAEGLRAGRTGALAALMARDYAVSALFASLISHDGSGALMSGWRRHLDDITSGRLRDGLRRNLLQTVWEARDDEEPRRALRAPLGTFAPEGDRWEGWWDKEPPPWPPGVTPKARHVVAALRRLPLLLRAVLLLRDVAGLGPADSAALLDNDHLDQPELLQHARDAYLVELDRELTSHDTGQ